MKKNNKEEDELKIKDRVYYVLKGKEDLFYYLFGGNIKEITDKGDEKICTISEWSGYSNNEEVEEANIFKTEKEAVEREKYLNYPLFKKTIEKLFSYNTEREKKVSRALQSLIK